MFELEARQLTQLAVHVRQELSLTVVPEGQLLTQEL